MLGMNIQGNFVTCEVHLRSSFCWNVLNTMNYQKVFGRSPGCQRHEFWTQLCHMRDTQVHTNISDLGEPWIYNMRTWTTRLFILTIKTKVLRWPSRSRVIGPSCLSSHHPTHCPLCPHSLLHRPLFHPWLWLLPPTTRHLCRVFCHLCCFLSLEFFCLFCSPT